MKNLNQKVMVPKEIAIIPPMPAFVFPLAKYYVTTFKTNRDALAGMLPDKVVAKPGAEDNVILQLNNFATYWEAVVSIPVIYKADGKDVAGIYLSQLYLGSIAPEGSALPMVLGQIAAGYPKRDAIFTVSDFGEAISDIKFERWGTTIVDMKHEMGDAITDFSNLPFGTDLTDMTAFLLKAIPSADTKGWSVLQLTSPQAPEGGDGTIVRVNKVKTTFNSDLVLDSGRVLPVKEQLSSLYFEIENMGLSHADILIDYLTD
jgi:hypothetical protein